MQIIAHWGVGHTPTLDDAGDVIRVADHGASTMPALLVAAIAGYPVALDVYETMDGTAVCWTSGIASSDSGSWISDIRSGDLKRMGIPLLSDVLESLLHRSKLFLELASFRSGRAAIEALRGIEGNLGNLTVSSHAISELEIFHEKFPGIPLAWSRDTSQVTPAIEIERTIQSLGIKAVHLEPEQCLSEVIEWYAGLGCIVRARNITDAVQAYAHVYEGVSAVITDHADKIRMRLAA